MNWCVDDGLLARCREAVKCGRDALVVGHNVPFDFRMLGNECRKFGYAVDLESFAFCDTLRMARRLLPGLPCYALDELIDELGLDAENTHDALDDTLACGALFLKLVRRSSRRLRNHG